MNDCSPMGRSMAALLLISLLAILAGCTAEKESSKGPREGAVGHQERDADSEKGSAISQWVSDGTKETERAEGDLAGSEPEEAAGSDEMEPPAAAADVGEHRPLAVDNDPSDRKMLKHNPLRAGVDSVEGPSSGVARINDLKGSLPRAVRADRIDGPTARARREEAGPAASREEELAAAPVGERRAAAGAAVVKGELPYDIVRVHYATDRAVRAAGGPVIWTRTTQIVLVVGVTAVFLFVLMGWWSQKRVFAISMSVISLTATIGWFAYVSYPQWQRVGRVAKDRLEYGNERGALEYGTCQVSIPRSHQKGELETRSLLRLEVREDVRKHIVLQSVEGYDEDPFFGELRRAVAAAERPEVFVFVHGYNVTFDDAARRTAQIAHDVHFAGAPIFFSWPSQGGLWKYTVDETNVTWSVPHLKQFLIDVARRSGAESINLVAHSMGSRALTGALREIQRELDGGPALFNQIILAAPDIDAEIFRRDLAPALVQSGRHVTLYASSNDQALLASKKVHGYPRAGDSGAGLVVMPGIDTIDVSQIDSSLLGHSYYGSSNSILQDIRYMIEQSIPPERRRWLRPRVVGDLTYWIFQAINETAKRGENGQH